MQRKVVLINYANKSYRKSQKKNSISGKSFGSFDKIISYNQKHIDIDFQNNNKEILLAKRGGGYWLWKPYFIKKTLESLNQGDFLFYCDSGSYFIDSINDLVALCENGNQDIIPFELSHYERCWTKRDAFVLMDCDNQEYYSTKQRLGGFILIRKSEISMKFVNEWLTYATDKRILTDLENQCGLDNYSEFQEHRHDQSIFSLLTKKYGFAAQRDPSQYGDNANEYSLHPESIYKPFIFLTRKQNYPLKTIIRKYLSKKWKIINSNFNKK